MLCDKYLLTPSQYYSKSSRDKCYATNVPKMTSHLSLKMLTSYGGKILKMLTSLPPPDVGLHLLTGKYLPEVFVQTERRRSEVCEDKPKANTFPYRPSKTRLINHLLYGSLKWLPTVLGKNNSFGPRHRVKTTTSFPGSFLERREVTCHPDSG